MHGKTRNYSHFAGINVILVSVMPDYKALITNRRARYDYQLDETLVAGLALAGHEVKSARAGHVNLKGAFASFRGNELWLNNVHISPYPPAGTTDYVPTQARKLLLHRRQLDQLVAAAKSGRSIVVLSLGVSGPRLKVELGIGRGQKHYDKRESIKRRQAERDAAKALRGRS